MGIPGPGPAAGPLPGPGGRRADAPSGETGGPVPARSREPPLREAPPLLPLASLIDALKLPPGRWSASILSFAKFFSLPLEGNFLSLIRRRALEAPVRP
ncbi:MAG: hypothetical protein LBO76_01280, partial [Treponema sp.]|nr:hypothetical protein [Treponema sp.]